LWSVGVGDVVDGEEVFVVYAQHDFLFDFCLVEAFDALVGAFGLVDLTFGGFVVDEVGQCAEGQQDEVEGEEDEDVDETVLVDDVLYALRGVEVAGGGGGGG
jgi:hypothetical protein